jgi:hypothetical protein
MKNLLTLTLLSLVSIFTLKSQTPANDAAMYLLKVPAYSEFTSFKLQGVFRNSGTDTLKSVIINYQVNNGQVKQYSKTDLKIVKNQNWPFVIPQEVVLNEDGDVRITAWVSQPNGVPDENNANDTLSQTIQVVEKYPERSILIEEVTGAWCGYCPRAPIIYNSVVKPEYPNTILVAVHNGDGMSIAESRDFQNTYVTGVPCGFVDRKKTQMDAGIDFAPESWEPLLKNLDNRFTPVDLHVYNYYEPETRNWKIDVVADFIFDITGNFRMNCYVLEDSLSGTGSSWEQRNFFNGGASDPYMSLQGAGDPIPGYQHNHVLRKMLGGSWGMDGIIPTTVKKGDRYVFSQTFQADTKWNMDHVHLVGIVQQWDQDRFRRPILNAVEGEVEMLTSTGATTLDSGLKVYPNPVRDALYLEFTSEGKTDSQLRILDALGREVYQRRVPAANGNRRLVIPADSFAPGIYYVCLTTGDQVRVNRIVRN